MPFPLSEFDSLSLEPYVMLEKYGRGEYAELIHAAAQCGVMAACTLQSMALNTHNLFKHNHFIL